MWLFIKTKLILVYATISKTISWIIGAKMFWAVIIPTVILTLYLYRENLYEFFKPYWDKIADW